MSTGSTLAPHEASLLHLVTDKAHHQLGWSPRWDVATTVERTVAWYRQVQEGGGVSLGLLSCGSAGVYDPSPVRCFNSVAMLSTNPQPMASRVPAKMGTRS